MRQAAVKCLLAMMLLPAAPCAWAADPVGAARGLPDCPGVNVFSTAKCARAAEARLKATFVTRESPQRLVITLLNGETKELRDATPAEFNNNDEAAAYSAIAVSPDSRYVSLHRQFWEGEAGSVLDRQTGREFKLDGYAVFSPDGRRVMVAGVDLAAGFSPNVLRIYRLAPTGPVLEHDAGAVAWGSWGPVDAVWTSPNSLQYRHATLDCDTMQQGVPTGCALKTLRFDGKSWR